MLKAHQKIKAGSGDTQAAVSQVEMEKLKKRLAQIEEDLLEKDRNLLDNETQMMTLTDQVEAY